MKRGNSKKRARARRGLREAASKPAGKRELAWLDAIVQSYAGGSDTRAAELLGLSRRSLYAMRNGGAISRQTAAELFLGAAAVALAEHQALAEQRIAPDLDAMRRQIDRARELGEEDARRWLRAEIEAEVRAELADRELPPAPPREEPRVIVEASSAQAAPAPHTEALLRSLGVGLPAPEAPPAPPEPPGLGLARVRWKGDRHEEDIPPARAARYVEAGLVDLVDVERDGPAVLAAHDARQDAIAARLQGDGLLVPGPGAPRYPDKFHQGRF